MDSPKSFANTSVSEVEASSTHVVYSDFNDAAGVAGEWDALAARAGTDVYSTYNWCRTWWEFYGTGRQLMIVAVRRGPALVAVMPLFHETLFSGGLPLRIVRIVGCDHTVSTCNVICEPGAENDAAKALSRALEQTGLRWDVIQFADLPTYAGNVDVFAGELQKVLSNCIVTAKAYDAHTFFQLPATYDEYIASLSTKERSHIRRDGRALAKADEVAYRVENRPEALAQAFEEFMDAHQSQWRTRGRLGHFDDWPLAREFHRRVVTALAEDSRVFITALNVGGETLVGMYCFRFGRFVHEFLISRGRDDVLRDINLVRLSFVRLVEYSISDNAQMIDSLRGYYDYKLKSGGTLGSLRSIMVTRGGLSAGIRFRLARIAGWLISKAYYSLWFKRIAPRTGLGGGPIWEAWIRAVK